MQHVNTFRHFTVEGGALSGPKLWCVWGSLKRIASSWNAPMQYLLPLSCITYLKAPVALTWGSHPITALLAVGGWGSGWVYHTINDDENDTYMTPKQVARFLWCSSLPL